MFSLEGGYVGTVDEESPFGVINGNGAVSDEILGKNLFELMLRRAPNLSINCSSLVRSFNFATWELCLIVSYS